MPLLEVRSAARLAEFSTCFAHAQERSGAAALHERALPKVRGPAPSLYEALAGPAPSLPIAPPPEAPLLATVAGGPVPIVPPVGGPAGGPPILSTIPGPGGGGGFTPPVQ